MFIDILYICYILYTILTKTCRKVFTFWHNFTFTTSQTELDYYHHRVSVRVASRVAEGLNTSQKIRKFQGKP